MQPGSRGRAERNRVRGRSRAGGLPAGALVVSAPLPKTPAIDNPSGLSARLASVIAGALGHGARASDEPAKLARARTLASTAGTLVHLSPELARGELRVTVDVYRAPKSFWDRVRDPEPSPSQHAFVSRKLDAELRTFLPPVPLFAKRIEKATTTEPDPVAIACGDADGDGAQEIVLVGRHRIQLGRIRGRTPPAPRHCQLGAALATVSLPAPRADWLRRIRSAGVLDVGSSDRLDAVRLRGDLALADKLGRRLPWPGGGCARIVGLSVRPEIEPCKEGDAAAVVSRMPEPADALAGALLVRKRRQYAIGASGACVQLALLQCFRTTAAGAVRISGAGAQLAVGDAGWRRPAGGSVGSRHLGPDRGCPGREHLAGRRPRRGANARRHPHRSASHRGVQCRRLRYGSNRGSNARSGVAAALTPAMLGRRAWLLAATGEQHSFCAGPHAVRWCACA